MKRTNRFALQMGVNLFAPALVIYEMYVGFSYGNSLFQNNHLSILIAVLFAVFPLFTIMAMAFMQMGAHTEKTPVVLISFCALVAGLAVQWFFQYGFMNRNLESKQAVAVQNSSQMQAHQSKLASIETTLKANEKYAAVDLAGVDATIALKKKQVAQIQSQKCPDWTCKESKPKQINALEMELAELEGQHNGAKTYKEALDARTAAFQSATTIHTTIVTDDAFIANVAVLMGYPREQSYHAFSVLYASFMISLFLVLTFFSSVRSELESLIEEKRARTRKSMPIQETADEPLQLTENAPEESNEFFKQPISTDWLNRKQTKEINSTEKLEQPLAFSLGELIINLESAPHIIVAGASNQGKSSTIRGVINQIIRKNTPNDVKFACVDLKRVELGVLRGLPHLAKPIATDKTQAFKLIEWVREEMDLRYELLEEKGVEKIQRLKEKIPYLILIIDEGAELAETMEVITDIARKGRAAGIHIIFATQYPTKQLLGNQFMEQMQTRICHFLKTPEASRAVLGVMPNNLNAYNIQNAGEAIIVDHKQTVQTQINYVSMDDLKETVSNAIEKYSKQPITQPEPAPKKTAFVNKGFNTSYTPTKVAFAPMQPMQPSIVAKAQMSDFGSNVVQFPQKMQPDATCNLGVAFEGSLALKNEENQQGRTATDLQPIEVAKPTLQPDKTQQNQQGRTATTPATLQPATLQPATYKVQPPLATSEVRLLVDWALNEMDATTTDQAIADFIFRATGRKLHKGSVNKYRNELQAKKEK